ncbi:MAG: hypothetical protein V4582_22110 [Pseudomonadota bacterium]
MFNPYILFAAISMILVVLAYAARFSWILGYPLADKSEVWGQFGDFMGGSLNPILSFITILLLIRSLDLQRQANADLREEVKENKKTEKLRSFGVLFFNLIASQKSLFESFTISADAQRQELRPGASSVIHIENEVERMRERAASNADIGNFLEECDADDKIYGILRAFYIAVKIVSEKLIDDDGFTVGDRKAHLLTLINFTDFAQLRLVILTIQFMDFPAAEYLRGNSDFNAVLYEVGLRLDPY